MCEFKVGDRVVCVDGSYSAGTLARGNTYTVTGVKASLNWGVVLNLEGIGVAWPAGRFRRETDLGPQSAAPSSVERVEAQSRDAAKQLNAIHQFPTGAVRGADASGTRFNLISPIALQALAETYAEGAAKYGDDNWLKGIPSRDLLNHALRHINLWQQGDASEPHLPHAIWNLCAIVHFEKTRPELIERPYAGKGGE